MAACSNINVGQSQTEVLIATINEFISVDTAPYTIIEYVSSQLGLPQNTPLPILVSSTNWCLVTCVSACLYENITFTPPETYVYTDKPTTYACVVSCFPVFTPGGGAAAGGGGGGGGGGAAGGGGGAAGGGGGAAGGGGGGGTAGGGSGGAAAPAPKSLENLDVSRVSQLDAIEVHKEYGEYWLEDVLDRAYIWLGVTIASFGVWIAMLAEHLVEITFADITKKIGEAIQTISKVLKATADRVMAFADKAMTSIEAITQAALPPYQLGSINATVHDAYNHMIRSVQGALTKIQGFFTDDIDNIGSAIEQIGEFLNDAADILWDLKEIAFAFASLAAMIREFELLIDHTYDRLDEVIEAAQKTLDETDVKYLEQLAAKELEIEGLEEFNTFIEDSVVKGKSLTDSAATALAKTKSNLVNAVKPEITIS
jgi:hypothetical protein